MISKELAGFISEVSVVELLSSIDHSFYNLLLIINSKLKILV